MTSATTSLSPGEQYRDFVRETSTRFESFKPLNSFIHSRTQFNPNNVTRITAINFSKSNAPTAPSEITELALEAELARKVDHQLFIVENISPTVMVQLGGYCNVDPQFFLDHLDASLGDISATTLVPNAKELQPIPWYRFRNIGEHLPHLRSMQSKLDHVHLRFIGSREYHQPQTGATKAELPDRIIQNSDRSNIERIAGGYNPISRNNERFEPLALARHGATAWFGGHGEQGEWYKGV